MHNTVFAATLPLLFMMAPSAGASQFPSYDPEPHCDRLAGEGSGRMDAVYQGCIRQEGAAYEWLDKNWKAIPWEMKKNCIESNESESYQALKNCILSEKSSSTL